MLLPAGLLEVLVSIYLLAHPSVNQLVIHFLFCFEDLLADLFLGSGDNI
jgi:hypothetical protein